MPEAPQLDSLERWMLALVTGRDGVDAAPPGRRAIEDVLEPGPHLSARSRLEIYADAYFWRLLEVLENDFPTVRRALGGEGFDAVGRAYLEAYPSRSPSLNALGRHFASWLADEDAARALAWPEGAPSRRFLADVARIEWTMEEVFDAPQCDVLPEDALQGLAPEDFAATRLPLIPALRLLVLEHPANDFVEALRSRDAEVPPTPAATRQHVAVYRSDFVVYRVPISAARFEILRALEGGSTLGEALEACVDAGAIDFEDLLPKIGPWFQEWSADGIFRALDA